MRPNEEKLLRDRIVELYQNQAIDLPALRQMIAILIKIESFGNKRKAA